MKYTAQIKKRLAGARKRDERDLEAMRLLDAGHTQREIAEALGFSQQHVSDLSRALRAVD